MKIYIRANISDDLDWVDSLVVTDYFDDFIKANIKNPDFFAWGKEAHIDKITDLWRELRTKHHIKDVHEIPLDDALGIVENGIRPGTMQGWFREGSRTSKSVLIDQILSRPDILNAGLNIAYWHYKCYCELQSIREGTTITPLSFNQWLYTPQVMYRGETGNMSGDLDIFYSYSPDPEVANKFGNYNNGSIHRIKIRPIDTWGSYSTRGEYEFLVPKSNYKKPWR